MITASIFNTVEFYIVTAFIAAAVVGYAALPSRRDPVRQLLVAGDLLDGYAPSEPGIVARVADNGDLEIYRFGIDSLADTGAYSLAVTIIGFDITVDERITPGRRGTAAVTAARAAIGGLGAERYHFLYRSDATGRSASFSLNIRPGNRIERRLS